MTADGAGLRVEPFAGVAVALTVADHEAHDATQHRLPLATRDRRALGTYQRLEVEVRLLE